MIMKEDDTFVDNLFRNDSKTEFINLINEVLDDISKEFKCFDSCRKTLAEKQFIHENLFKNYEVKSIYELGNNDQILNYYPEIYSYINIIQLGIVFYTLTYNYQYKYITY